MPPVRANRARTRDARGESLWLWSESVALRLTGFGCTEQRIGYTHRKYCTTRHHLEGRETRHISPALTNTAAGRYTKALRTTNVANDESSASGQESLHNPRHVLRRYGRVDMAERLEDITRDAIALLRHP